MPYKTAADLIAEAKQRITEISVPELRDALQRGEEIALIDVREDREWNLGHVPRATHMSRGTLESKIDQAVPRERRVVLYCATGNRSALAAEALHQMGYTNVASLAGGFRAWVDSGGDVQA